MSDITALPPINLADTATSCEIYRKHLERLIDRIDKLEAVVKAARECDNAAGHVIPCPQEHGYSRCTCGHFDLRKALASLDGDK